MSRLAEMFPDASYSISQGIYQDAAELKKEELRLEEKEIRGNAGEVKSTVDFFALEKISSKRPFSPATPTLRITKDHIRISAVASEKIGGDKVELRANEHFIALKAVDDGIQCRKEHNGKGSRRGLYIDRSEIVKQLLSKGWAVGMSVELHWDEEGQFLWGRKPKGEKIEHGS